MDNLVSRDGSSQDLKLKSQMKMKDVEKSMNFFFRNSLHKRLQFRTCFIVLFVFFYDFNFTRYLS